MGPKPAGQTAEDGAPKEMVSVRQHGADRHAMEGHVAAGSVAGTGRGRRRRISQLYRIHFADARRERLFLSSASFFMTFGATRTITHAIRKGKGPFHNVSAGGLHVHHLVFGIALLLGTGYLNLLEPGQTGSSDVPSRAKLTSCMYGAGSALTLDEFALWLNLADVYWASQGRESIDAVVLSGAALSMGVWGAPFLKSLVREFLVLDHLAQEI